jgi:hypothetical protein
MNIANGLGIPLTPIDAARDIAERKVKRSDVGEVAGKVFFETCGIGIDADMFGAARLAERGRCVVIGDAHGSELRLTRELCEVGDRDAAIARVLGVHVHVEPDPVHPRASAAVRMPPAKSGSGANRAVTLREGKYGDGVLELRGPGGIDPRVADDQRGPCCGTRVQGRTSNIKRLPGAG